MKTSANLQVKQRDGKWVLLERATVIKTGETLDEIQAVVDTEYLVPGYPYTRKQLLDAFTKVQDKTHWKNPIDAVISDQDIDITVAAIGFFTGCEASYVPHGEMNVRITADGYFLTIGA